MSEEREQPARAEDFLHLELRDLAWHWKENRRSLGISALVHLSFVLAMAIPVARNAIVGEPILPHTIQVRFYEVGGEGPGGGGGGGGSQGARSSAFIRAQPEPAEELQPRQGPIAPRRIPPIRADSLKVPDLPADTAFLFEQVLSPDALPTPGLSLSDQIDRAGADTRPSAGAQGGTGGGQGTGVGTGTGWGVGPGEGGGFGGGRYRRGAWDIDPIAIYEHRPAYPPLARQKLVSGEVILEILVRRDGSTEVLRVLKSLGYGCEEAAIAAARLYRWKPALKKGKPVEAVGVLFVKFNLFEMKKG